MGNKILRVKSGWWNKYYFYAGEGVVGSWTYNIFGHYFVFFKRFVCPSIGIINGSKFIFKFTFEFIPGTRYGLYTFFVENDLGETIGAINYKYRDTGSRAGVINYKNEQYTFKTPKNILFLTTPFSKEIILINSKNEEVLIFKKDRFKHYPNEILYSLDQDEALIISMLLMFSRHTQQGSPVC